MLVLVSGFVIVVLLVLVALAVIVILMLGGAMAIIFVEQMAVVAINTCVMLVLKAWWNPGDVGLTKLTRSSLKGPRCGQICGQRFGKSRDSWYIRNKGLPQQFDEADMILAERYTSWCGRIHGWTHSKNRDNWNIKNKGSP